MAPTRASGSARPAPKEQTEPDFLVGADRMPLDRHCENLKKERLDGRMSEARWNGPACGLMTAGRAKNLSGDSLRDFRRFIYTLFTLRGLVYLRGQASVAIVHFVVGRSDEYGTYLSCG